MARARLAASAAAATSQEPPKDQEAISLGAPIHDAESSGPNHAHARSELNSELPQSSLPNPQVPPAEPRDSLPNPQASHPEPGSSLPQSPALQPERPNVQRETDKTPPTDNLPLSPGAAYINQRYSRRHSEYPSANAKEIERWGCNVFYGVDAKLFLWERFSRHLGWFVRDAFPAICQWRLLDKSTKADLTAIAPKVRLFCDDLQRHCMDGLFEGWVWRLFWNHLFSPECMDKWAGEQWSNFGRLQMSLREAITNEDNPYTVAHHSARHRTAHMLYMRHGPHTHHGRLMDILWEKMVPVIRIRDHPDNNPTTRVLFPDLSDHSSENSEAFAEAMRDRLGEQELKEKLSQLVKDAIKLDLYTIGSDFHVKIDLNDPSENGHGQAASGFPFRRDLMEICNIGPLQWHNTGAKGRPVDFVRTPLIRVYGGTEYCSYKDRATRTLTGGLVRHFHRFEAIRMSVVVDQYTEAGAEALKNSVMDEREEDEAPFFLEMLRQQAMRRKKKEEAAAAAAEAAGKETVEDPTTET
jgi:hypothetical protein